MANILIVDDDKTITRVIQASLKQLGHGSAVAYDGHSAWDMLNNELFDLIITDINMPHGVNGYFLTRLIREKEEYRTVPLLIVSGQREKEAVERAVRGGADDFLVKPLDLDILNAKVSALLAKSGNKNDFVDTPTNDTGILNINLGIIGLSEQGMRATCTFPLPLNIKFRIESPIFEKIGIKSPMLRVSACEGSKGKESTFILKLSFIGLTSEELTKIRVWNRSNSVKIRDVS